MSGIGIAIPILLVLLALAVILGTWASRYAKVGPDEALFISGRKQTITLPDGTLMEVGYRIVINGGTFVWPIVEKVGHMSLRVMDTTVSTSGAMSIEGVPIEVDGTALFKVSSSPEGVANAAERYMGVTQEEILADVKQVLEGHLRGVVGQMTPEEIYRDRVGFQNKIVGACQYDLDQLGIILDTLTLREIKDAQGYLDALGQRRTAQVKSDARIGQAEAEREAAVAEAENRRQAEVAQAQADTEILEAQKIRDVRKAQFAAERNAEEARAEQAGYLATSEAEQQVTEAKTELARREAQRKEQELEATEIRPAIARRRAIEEDATAAQTKLRREGDGEADKIRAIGAANADSTKAALLAEADGIRAKAESMERFNSATMDLELSRQLIETLPRIIEASVKPLQYVDKIEIVDFGSGGNGSGTGGAMSKLLNLSPEGLKVADESVKRTLGVGLLELIERIRSGDTSAIRGAAKAASESET